eukprot:TRINITY_DN3630_c0_g1_i1.p1 TRINITY_DN3630_c0_g1~~TRINITY_DN3630_c0_g1_i1.p1  ORF type:complete len:580 (+),score=224.26 TRINITY_DN3630_c0_g1_i1:82-1821(+)
MEKMKIVLILFYLLHFVTSNSVVRDFQIKTPIRRKMDKVSKECVVQLSNEHPFFNFDPLIVQYKPPTQCGAIGKWSMISLNITATVNGTQYDRLGLFFINNVEIWRTSSSEPTKAGIVWSTLKEVTRYRSLFATEGKAVFHLGNEVFGPYTGIFRTTITLVFHPEEKKKSLESYPDQILSIIQKQNGNDSNPFSIGQTSLKTPSFSLLTIPQNTKEAWVEIFASGNGNEEFWYTNVPDSLAQNFSAIGKGPFREVQLFLDGELIGSAFPCPVIFTGGINPLLWRPSHSYGALDQPTYYIDVSPHLGKLTDGKPHNFTLNVAGMGTGFSINDNWFVTGNLQLRLAKCSGRTTGRITYNSVGPTFLNPSLSVYSTSNTSVYLKVLTTRTIQIKAALQTCEGKLNVKYFQKLNYQNVMTLSNGGNDQTVNQQTTVNANSMHNDVIVFQESSSFPLVVNTTLVVQGPVQILGSIVNRSFSRITTQPFELDKKTTVLNQDASGNFKMKNNIGFAGEGNQTLFFSYKDDEGFTYERHLSIVKNYLNADQEYGTLKGYPSGFNPNLIDGPDAPPSEFPIRSPRLMK